MTKPNMESKKVTDKAEIQQIENSIRDGYNMLRAGIDAEGIKLTPERRFSIRKAVLNAESKIRTK